jgi:eukaryotic-like serine/threonine-protein kinase
MNADRNLLFGILALQNNVIDRQALVAAFDRWASDKARPLSEILVEMGKLDDDQRQLLEALAAQHINLHNGDEEKSLAALSSLGSARQDLEKIADADVQASLAGAATILPDASPVANSFGRTRFLHPRPTRAISVGTTSSSGQRFRILRPHAKGGLGQISVALDEELHREVAFKEIQERYADDPASRTRFVLEAEVTGGLEHPGIVPVYGLGQYADGRPFYAMRFIRGDSLSEAIKRFHNADNSRRSPAEMTLELRKLLGRFIDVCNAIEYAHSRGVLHRDLKPGNIMLGKYGETLVVDWGLAKPLGHRESNAGDDERALLPVSPSGSAPTQLGSAVGTPQYMSPEQAEGRVDELGPATDVYSLGATLYCLLTGRAPFADGDQWATIAQVAAGEFPPPRTINKSVPPALEAISLKAMALRPRDRYASAQALASDVEQWLADGEVSVYVGPWQERLATWARQHTTAASALSIFLGVTLIMIPVASVGWTIGRFASGRSSSGFDADVGSRQADAVISQMTAKLSSAPNPWALYERGRAYRSLGKWPDAIADLTEAINQKPDFAEAFYARGLAHARSGSHALAVADFTETIRLAPTHPDAYYDLALANYHLGAYQKALADCTRLVELRPASARAYGLRSGIYMAKGDHLQAGFDRAMAQALDPNFTPFSQ